MSFGDIKGQDRAISFLKSSIENKRLSHAYIFLGPKGVGKRSVALNFAKVLNCEKDLPERPCDKCTPCIKIDGSNHPDIFLLEPEKKGGSIKIEQVRELIKNIGLKPYEGRSKVYIIDEAESMTIDAANALLKTLEEPPPDSILILIVENLGAIFKTIVSRSQIVRFYPVRTADIEDILIKRHKMTALEAHVISLLSSGSIGDALRFKEEDLFEKREVLIKKILADNFFDSDFEGLSKGDLKLYLELMITWYRDILIKKAGMEDSMLVNIDKTDNIAKEAKRMSAERLGEIIDQIILTYSFLDRNANTKLAMSVLGLNIQEA